MSIQDLGSIGELVAAIATIATLIYLALQIKSSTRVSWAESRRAAMTQTFEISALIANNAELASIFRRGLASPDALDANEGVRFTFLFSMLVSQFHSSFEDNELGIISQKVFEDTTRQQLRLLNTPGGRHYWQEYNTGYATHFIEYVEQRLKSGDQSGN